MEGPMSCQSFNQSDPNRVLRYCVVSKRCGSVSHSQGVKVPEAHEIDNLHQMPNSPLIALQPQQGKMEGFPHPRKREEFNRE
eukprot:860379-Amphidinium_carterae.3